MLTEFKVTAAGLEHFRVQWYMYVKCLLVALGKQKFTATLLQDLK